MHDTLTRHFTLTDMPFRRDLEPAALHRYNDHQQACARITWTIADKALGVLTGEVGVGKTVAVRSAIAALDPTKHTIIYIANPAVGTRGICHHIVVSLGRKPHLHRAILIPQAAEALATEAAERARTPVVVIDEAHLLEHDQLESIRMLTNHDLDSRTPAAILLVGQPTLRRQIPRHREHKTPPSTRSAGSSMSGLPDGPHTVTVSLTLDPTPTPHRAAAGIRLHRLDLDPPAVCVVARIFGVRIGGLGAGRIAARLNAGHVPCPSAHDRVRNRHRSGVAWTVGTVLSILGNPRYTGYQVWNKQTTAEVLIDPGTSPKASTRYDTATLPRTGYGPACPPIRPSSAPRTSTGPSMLP